MNAVLHKGSSGTARDANLALSMPPRPVSPKPDERDAEIARLKAEREDLRQKLAAAEQRRDDELALLKAQAKQAAADEFHQNDARRLELLAQGVERSVAAFESQLLAQSRELAPRLARHALARLVRVNEAEANWLVRAVELRLDDLGSQTVLGVHVAASDWSEALIAQLRGRLGDGVVLSRDASLGSGSVRIGLRLGEVTVDPSAGLAELLKALVEGRADD